MSVTATAFRKGLQMTLVADQYFLMGEPKQGGMSQLFRATDVRNDGRIVAVKLYKAAPLQDDVLRESFRRERLALRELRHPNIVNIENEGLLNSETQYFVAIEWLDKLLSDQIDKANPLDWGTFFKIVGRPILTATAFAHSRAYVHRDIKTSNVMFDKQGIAKLIDFGTSKLKKYISYGVTLKDFYSTPFSPSERDDGENVYTRDTYGFCVMALDCVTRMHLQTREDVIGALEEARLSPRLKEIFDRALSDDPDSRYGSADELLADLEDVERKRISLAPQRPDVFLRLTNKALSVVRENFNLHSEDAAVQFVIGDVNSVCGLRRYSLSTQAAEDVESKHFLILGAEMSYHTKIDHTRDRLVVLSARKQSSFELERQRDHCLQSPVRFRSGSPTTQASASTVLDDLVAAITDFETAQIASEKQAGFSRLFDVWRSILELKSEYELQRQDPLAYDRYDIDEARIYFRCTSNLEEEHIGQKRIVRQTDGSILSGEITEIDFESNELTFVVLNASPDVDRLPGNGVILVDDAASKVSLDRQRSALEAVRSGSKDSVRSDLRDLIATPSKIPSPNEPEDVVFKQSLDADKQVAVRNAVGSDSFLLIEGPPGTGKTTVITEIVLQMLQRMPDARILLTSQTNVALDNAIQRIQELSTTIGQQVSITRLGRPDDARIDPSVQSFLLPNRIKAWQQNIIRASEDFLESWAVRHGFDRKQVQTGIHLQQIVKIKRELAQLDDQEKSLKQFIERVRAREDMNEESEDDRPVAIDTTDDEKNAQRELARLRDSRLGLRRRFETLRAELSKLGDFEADIADESIECMEDYVSLYKAEGPDADQLERLLNLSAEWQLRFGIGAEFHTALMAETSVVAGTCIGVVGFRGAHEVTYDLCILDEASKATATEALVPLARSRRWIMVGDLKQLPPFQDEALKNHQLLERSDLNPDDVKETLFSHLLTHINPSARVKLTTQRRMVKEIGELISHCFYEGALITPPDARMDIDLATFLGGAVRWVSTQKLEKRHEERVGDSIRNDKEAEIVLKQLKQLNNFASSLERKYSVCVLTPYSGQIKALKRRILPELPRWLNLNVEINTVDAYQGREADIAIVSLVRSNAGNQLGFLRETERLNVALSRGRYALIVVGDLAFMSRATEPNPFRVVVEHIRISRGCNIVEAQREH